MTKENTDKRKDERDKEVTDPADKESTEGLDYCVNPGNPEAVRHNEDEDACDQGRGGTFEEKL